MAFGSPFLASNHGGRNSCSCLSVQAGLGIYRRALRVGLRRERRGYQSQGTGSDAEWPALDLGDYLCQETLPYILKKICTDDIYRVNRKMSTIMQTANFRDYKLGDKNMTLTNPDAQLH